MKIQEAMTALGLDNKPIAREAWPDNVYLTRKSLRDDGPAIKYSEEDGTQQVYGEINIADINGDDWFVYIWKAERQQKERHAVPVINEDNSSWTISMIMQQANATALEKGFWDIENNERQLAYMISELSEALEEMHNPRRSWQDIELDEKGKPCGLSVEFADCIIRICDFAQHHQLPLIDAIKTKMAYNKTRSYQHGRSL